MLCFVFQENLEVQIILAGRAVGGDNVVFILYYYCFNIFTQKITCKGIALPFYQRMNNEHSFYIALAIRFSDKLAVILKRAQISDYGMLSR